MTQQQVMNNVTSGLSNANFGTRIQAVHMLRAVNKQFPRDSNVVLSHFASPVVQMLKGPKTVEQKVILLYFLEVISNEPSIGLGPDVISTIQPAVCLKAVTGKGFIKKLSEELMILLITRCSLEGMAYSLSLGCLHRNTKVAEVSSLNLLKIFKREPISAQTTQNAILSFSKDLFLVLFRSVIQSLQSKRFQVVKSCEDTLSLLLGFLGQEKFVYIIELMLQEQGLSPQIKQLVSKGIQNAQEREQKVAAKENAKLVKLGVLPRTRANTQRNSMASSRTSMMSNQSVSRYSLYSNQMDQMRLSNFQRIQASPMINGSEFGGMSAKRRHNSLTAPQMQMSRESSGQSLKQGGHSNKKSQKKGTKRKSGLSEFIKNQRKQMKQSVMGQQPNRFVF